MPLVVSSLTDAEDVIGGFGPCGPWPIIWPCEEPSGDTKTQVVQAATEILHALSGRQFGLCQVTLRPCRRDCADAPWWPGTVWPRPALVDGLWYNLACGICPESCSCSRLSEVLLPAPVFAVQEVKVDGTVLPSTSYRVDDSRRLIRTDGGEWPRCNNFALADTEAGTWSVTATYGQPVPMLGELAMGELACSLLPILAGEDCPLPPNITQLVRQGVTITMPDPNEVIRQGGLGLRISDLFVRAFNPHALPARSRVYSVDGPSHRRMG